MASRTILEDSPTAKFPNREPLTALIKITGFTSMSQLAANPMASNEEVILDQDALKLKLV